MVCEACGARLPFDELIKRQEEEEVLSGPQPELMNFLMSVCLLCIHVSAFSFSRLLHVCADWCTQRYSHAIWMPPSAPSG